MRRVLVLGIVGITLSLLGAPGAAAQAAPTPDAPKIAVSPAEVKLQLTDITGESGRSTHERGTANIVLANSGKVAGAGTLSLTLDNEDGSCPSSGLRVGDPDVNVPAGKTVTKALTVDFPDGCAGESGFLVLSPASAPAADPVITRFSGTKDFAESQLWNPIRWAAIGAVGFVVVLCWVRRRRLTATVSMVATWSFKDSWLTNISALGAVLVSVLAATGLLQAVVPATKPDRLAGLALLFGAAVLVAPVIYMATSRWSAPLSETGKDGTEVYTPATSQGTVGGLVLAGGFTLFGVFGELFTLRLIDTVAQGAQTVKLFLQVSIWVAVVIVVIYALNFTLGATAAEPERSPSDGAAGRRRPPKPIANSAAL